MTAFSLAIQGQKPMVGDLQIESSVQLYFHKEDRESGVWNGELRPCAGEGCPAVFWFSDASVRLTRQWQYYLIAMNYNMSYEHVSAVLNYKIAFTNHQGFEIPGDPRANYILDQNLDCPLPKLDAVRTCARSVMTGVESGTDLIVTMFDGTKEPPLKPGRTYPNSREDINPDDYLYNPRYHRWMFFAANNVKAMPGGGSIVFPFAQGAGYGWTGTQDPYVWIPHVSPVPVRYTLARLIRIQPGSDIPSPYRR